MLALRLSERLLRRQVLCRTFASTPRKMRKSQIMIRAEKTRVEELKKVDEESEQKGLPLELVLSTICERLPVIMPDLEDWEVEFEAHREKARLYTHKQYPKEIFKSNNAPVEPWVYNVLSYGTGKIGPASEGKPWQEDEKQTEADGNEDELEDSELKLDSSWDDEEDETDIDWSSEAEVGEDDSRETKVFRPAPRITQADKTGDTKSLDRCLAHRLYLIVKVHDVVNGGECWRFPQEPLQSILDRQEIPKMTLKAAAQDSLDHLCEQEMELYYIGNAPSGFNKFVYPENVQKERKFYGSQVFFYRAQSLEGNAQVLNNKEGISDFAWIKATEISDFVADVENDPYWSYASQFMEKE